MQNSYEVLKADQQVLSSSPWSVVEEWLHTYVLPTRKAGPVFLARIDELPSF